MAVRRSILVCSFALLVLMALTSFSLMHGASLALHFSTQSLTVQPRGDHPQQKRQPVRGRRGLTAGFEWKLGASESMSRRMLPHQQRTNLQVPQGWRSTCAGIGARSVCSGHGNCIADRARRKLVCMCVAGFNGERCERSMRLVDAQVASWDVGQWSDCSRACGGGVSVRSVRCTVYSTQDKKKAPARIRVVSASVCGAAKVPRPASSRPCRTFHCGTRVLKMHLGFAAGVPAVPHPPADLQQAERIWEDALQLELALSLGVLPQQRVVVDSWWTAAATTAQMLPSISLNVDVLLLLDASQSVAVLLETVQKQVRSADSLLRSGTVVPLDGRSKPAAAVVTQSNPRAFGLYLATLRARVEHTGNVCEHEHCSGHGECFPLYEGRHQGTRFKHLENIGSSAAASGVSNDNSEDGTQASAREDAWDKFWAGERTFHDPAVILAGSKGRAVGERRARPVCACRALFYGNRCQHRLAVEKVYDWEIGPWSSCSRGCGGGTRTRSVVCGEFEEHAVRAAPRGAAQCSEGGRLLLVNKAKNNVSSTAVLQQRNSHVASAGALETLAKFGAVQPVDTERCNMLHCSELYLSAALAMCTSAHGLQFSDEAQQLFRRSLTAELSFALRIADSRIVVRRVVDLKREQREFSGWYGLEGRDLEQCSLETLAVVWIDIVPRGQAAGQWQARKSVQTEMELDSDRDEVRMLLHRLVRQVEDSTSRLRSTGKWGRLIISHLSQGMLSDAHRDIAVGPSHTGGRGLLRLQGLALMSLVLGVFVALLRSLAIRCGRSQCAGDEHASPAMRDTPPAVVPPAQCVSGVAGITFGTPRARQQSFTGVPGSHET